MSDKKQYSITIVNRQDYDDDGQEPNTLTLTAHGEYTYSEVGKHISFPAFPENAGKGVLTIDINSDGVIYSKSGDEPAHMMMQVGKRSQGFIDLGFASAAVGIYTHYIEDRLTALGGTLRLSYSMDLDSNFISNTEISITVRENKNHV